MKSKYAQPSSQFNSWLIELHVLNEATTRTIRGKPAYTGTKESVSGKGNNIGRGYKPNKKDPANPKKLPKMDNWEVRFDP